VVVVSIGHDRSTFAVSDGRVCEFTRVLDWGGSTLDVAIARELDLAPSEASRSSTASRSAAKASGRADPEQALAVAKPSAASSRPSRGSSSPRSSSTRTSPDLWASARS
jgi:Tfp pilus assembly PilM family ATPase